MKKLAIILFLSFSPLTVFAITQAPGQVPIYEPLQPAPEGVKPNIEQNVQAGSAEPYWADKENGRDDTDTSEEVSVQRSSEDYIYSTSSPANKSSIGLWVILSVLAVAVLVVGYRFYRTSKKYV